MILWDIFLIEQILQICMWNPTKLHNNLEYIEKPYQLFVIVIVVVSVASYKIDVNINRCLGIQSFLVQISK